MPSSNVYSAAKYVAKQYLGQDRYRFVKSVGNALLSTAPGKTVTPSTAKIVKATKLGKYLDKTFERKCGVEIKRYQTSGQTYAIGTSFGTGTGTCMPGDLAIASGTLDDERVGNTIEIKRIRLNYKLSINAASTLPVDVRLMFVKLHQNAGSAPTGSQLLWDATNIRSLRYDQKEATRSYTVLKEMKFQLTPASLGSGRSVINFSWNYTPKGCHRVTWLDSDSTGAVTNLVYGQIYVYSIYETAGVAGAPALVSYLEYEYTDV